MPDINPAELDAALAEAHIPSLMMALVHLTGSADHLTPARTPMYVPLGDEQGEIPEAERAAVRALSRQAILDHAAGKSLPPQPDEATVWVRQRTAQLPPQQQSQRVAPALLISMSV